MPNDPFGLVSTQNAGDANLLHTLLFTGLANGPIGIIRVKISIIYIPVDAI